MLLKYLKSRNKGGEFMLVPYSKLKDNIKPLAGLMASDITIEKLYNVVIEYASKAADEYQPGEMCRFVNDVLHNRERE